jgi:hypothetical protein
MAERHLREPHFYVVNRWGYHRSAGKGGGIDVHAADPGESGFRWASDIEASSERSAALYERLGFLHMGVFELPEGGAPVWPMRRLQHRLR